MSTTIAEPRMLIDGRLVDAASGRTFSNENPATEEIIGEVADGGPEDVAAAVAAARRAFDGTSWATDHKLRRRCIEQLQQGLEEVKEDFRPAMVAESGTPVFLTYNVQLDSPVGWLSFWAELADGYAYEESLEPMDFMGIPTRGVRIREPIGVVGGITPFNFPLYLTLAKLGPALAAGCTFVLKPSPLTPWSATILGKVIAERTEIPPGVVNIVTASGAEAGEALVADPRVDMISFTGSTATGRKIMAACAATVKKCFLELGGKSANIVLDDADLPSALGMSVPFACSHGGQACAAYTRLLLPRSRYDEALALLEPMVGGFPYGDPTDPGHLQGPLISGPQRDRVLATIERAVAEGSRLLVGGKRPAHLERGYYVEPTLFADVDPSSNLAQEEVFGPVLAVIPFTDEDDAVRIANDSMYGLSGGVWSATEERAMRVARRVRTGTIGVNGGQWLSTKWPFGGYKQSGIGRENGVEGFEEYLQVKAVGLPGA